MEWTDEGLILSARPHGETSMIVTLLTSTRGRHAGLVHGGQGRRHGAGLQPGTHVAARWKARLSDHLGALNLETIESFAAPWLGSTEVLAFIASATAMVEASLPERHPMPQVFSSLMTLFSLKDETLWPPSYIRWELGVLEALGYGLDLSCCALTGAKEGLAFISPRTGRAVTAEAAAPYGDRLLPLPPFLCGVWSWNAEDILNGLELSGHFFSRHVFAHPQNRRLVPQDGTLPLARQRLTETYKRNKEKTENATDL